MLRPTAAELLSHLLPASILPGTNLLAIKPRSAILAILAWHALRTNDSVRPFRRRATLSLGETPSLLSKLNMSLESLRVAVFSWRGGYLLPSETLQGSV